MNIETLYQQAELAMASYAENLTSNASNIDALKKADMTQAQAAAFAEEWKVIDQYTAPSTFGVTESGFSATVFQVSDAGNEDYYRSVA